ncbi:hypothetical protein [Paracidovorax avenae]|uniref:hypothetical protein n=1 Tax=Paracidovorax avenae TaxID=80867 RepID=UPI00126039A3|nr:hypothetical protein [Paracidovorax avenae]
MAPTNFGSEVDFSKINCEIFGFSAIANSCHSFSHFLVLLFYDVNIALDIYDRVVNALVPLIRILLTFMVLVVMPFYFGKRAGYKNSYAKWLTLIFAIFLMAFSPSFGISEIFLSKLYYKNFADEIFISRNSDLVLHLKLILQGGAAGAVVFSSRAIPVLLFLIASISLERKFSRKKHD